MVETQLAVKAVTSLPV